MGNVDAEKHALKLPRQILQLLNVVSTCCIMMQHQLKAKAPKHLRFLSASSICDNEPDRR
jgi:hypothetical protein